MKKNIIIEKRLDNTNITFEYGRFIKTLGLQLKEQTKNKYILENSSYLSELAEKVFVLFDEKLISEKELNRIINDLDNKVRTNIKENPAQMKYKYRKLSTITGKHNNRNEKTREKIIDIIIDLYFNKNMKQIEIARKLQIEPGTISYIIHKENYKRRS